MVRLRRLRGDSAVGVLSTVFGLTFFLGFLLFATQLSLRLYESSSLGSDAYRAARIVAGDAIQRAGPAAVAAAIAEQTAVLAHRYQASKPEIRWGDPTADDVVLEITIHMHGELVTGLDGVLGLASIHRTARVHREIEP